MAALASAGESVGDLYQRGFRLAYFIVRDRTSAIRIVIQSWNKLNARCRQEGKRSYWRDKYLKRWVTKISRTDCDALQWLIYFESEQYEKRQEEDGEATTESLVIHYVKSLVQISTAFSCFYVVTGLHRLLHDYSTSDVQRVYEMLTERYLGADEYRRAKRFLMNKLASRFGDLLRTVTTAHGEMRFELLEDQGRWVDLVHECLTIFIPWSTSGICLVPRGFGPASMPLPSLLSGSGRGRLSPDAVETNRCHALIDPICFSRLVRSLRFDPPEQRLALPKFLAGNYEKRRDISGSPPEPPSLTPGEKEMIQANLERESARRKNSEPQNLRLVVDGVERDQVTLGPNLETRLELEAGAKLIEIWTQDENGDVVLGTHLVGYSDSYRIKPSTSSLAVAGISLALIVSAKEGSPAGMLTLTSHPTERTNSASIAPFPVRSFGYGALALFFIGIGWTLGLVHYRHELVSQRARAESIERKAAAASSTVIASAEPRSDAIAAIVTQELVPYELSTRGGGSAALPVIYLPAHATLLKLELPIGGRIRRPLHASLKLLPEQHEIMTERLSSPARGEGLEVFSVPVDLLSGGKDYLIELGEIDASGTLEQTNSFVFHISQSDR